MSMSLLTRGKLKSTAHILRDENTGHVACLDLNHLDEEPFPGLINVRNETTLFLFRPLLPPFT